MGVYRHHSTDFSMNPRREKLRLVDHHEHGIPMVALNIEHAAEEGGCGAFG